MINYFVKCTSVSFQWYFTNLFSILLWTDIKPVSAGWSDVKQGSLHFSLVPGRSTGEINNIRVNNSAIQVSCHGPYIVYPYIERSGDGEFFNITVVRGENVIGSMPFNTTDSTTWKSMILDLNKGDHISVFVSCVETCPFVGRFCLALNFLLGNACTQWLSQSSWTRLEWGQPHNDMERRRMKKVHCQVRRHFHEFLEQECTPEWYFWMKVSAQVFPLMFWSVCDWICQSKEDHADITTENICQCFSSGYTLCCNG